MWAEYLKSELDLGQDGGVIDSRSYIQGKQSLDGAKVFVRFIGGESVWPGGTTYFTAIEASLILQGADYVEPPTAEEIMEIQIAKIQFDAGRAESGGIVWTDGAGESWAFKTDDKSVQRLAFAQIAMTKGKRIEGGPWGCGSIDELGVVTATFRSMSNAELSDVADAIYADAANVGLAMVTALTKASAGDTEANFQAEYDLL
jgi:hypothetical protein